MRTQLVLFAPALLLLAGFALGCGASAPTEPTAPAITADDLRTMPAEEADSLSTRQNLAQPRNVKLVGRF